MIGGKLGQVKSVGGSVTGNKRIQAPCVLSLHDLCLFRMMCLSNYYRSLINAFQFLEKRAQIVGKPAHHC